MPQPRKALANGCTCPYCGVAIGDVGLHRSWHEAMSKAIELRVTAALARVPVPDPH